MIWGEILQIVMAKFVFFYKSGETAKTFFPCLKAFLHAIIGEANENWLQNLIFRIEAVLGLSPLLEIGQLNSARTQKDKLLALLSVIESRDALSDTALEDSLNCIINYPLKESYTAGLRKQISGKFSEYIEIVDVQTERATLNQSAPIISNPTQNVDSITDSATALLNPTTNHSPAGDRVVCKVVVASCSIMIIITSFVVLMLHLTLPSPTTTENVPDLSGNETFVNNTIYSSNNNSSFVPNLSSMGEAENGNNSTQDTSDNYDTSTIASNDIKQRPSVIDQNNINLKTVRYKVTSCEDYKTSMTNPPQNRRIYMHIHLSSPYDWENCDMRMDNAEKISKLSIDGPITLADTFLKILNHTKNLEELRLSNTKGAFCDRNKGQLPTLTHLKVIGVQKVQLPRLNTLYMQDFTSCKEVYETLANHVSYGKLSRFAMRQCVYDEENQVQIEHLLETNRGSLKSVSLPATTWATTLASHNLDVLGKVESLKIDFIPHLNSFSRRYLGTRFGRVFPNIVNFTSSAGYLPFDQLPDIFQLKGLENIQIGINVPEGNDQFDVSFLQNFPDMVKAEFFLEFQKFQNCGTGNRKKIVGLNTLSVKQSSLIILSNCRLFTPDENLNQRNEIFSKKGVYFVYKSLT